MLGRRFLLSLVIALFFSTLASANSTTVNMTSLYTGTNVSGGYHTYPYYFSINGEKTMPMIKHAPASGPRPQVFIGYRGTPVSTPEPASLLLLSTGLIGIAGLVRRKLRA